MKLTCICPFLSPPLCMSLSLYFCVYLSVCLSICFTLELSLFVAHFRSFSLILFVFLSISLSVAFCLASVSLCCSLYFFLSRSSIFVFNVSVFLLLLFTLYSRSSFSGILIKGSYVHRAGNEDDLPNCEGRATGRERTGGRGDGDRE